MFKLDNDFLISLGLGGMPVDEKNKLLQTIYERLEMNVGMRLAEKMTDQQLDEFEGFIDRNDEAGALRWLEANFPNYKQVVAEELEKLKAEVQAAAPQILASSQAAVPQPTQVPAPGQPQYGPAPAPQPYAPSTPPVPSGPQPMVDYPPQPAQVPVRPQPTAYNPENPFQTQSPEFAGTPGQPSAPQFSPAPASPQQPVFTPNPMQPPQPGQPVPSPWQQDVPAQQPPAGPGAQPPQPPVDYPQAQ